MLTHSALLFKKRNLVTVIPVDDHHINDVEAGPKPTILPKSHSNNSNNSNKDFKKMNSIALIYIFFVIVTVCAMFVPIFISFRGIHSVSYSGIFGDALRNSSRLKIMESISIGCALPMLSDKFLDQVTDKNTKMTLSMWHRILFLVAFTISSILYLNLSDYYFMPYLYIVLNDTKIFLVGAVTSYSVLNGTIMKSLRGKIIFFFPVVIGGSYYVFEAYSLLFPEYPLLSSIKTILFFLLFVSFCTVLIPWFYLLWCRYRVNKTLNYEEKKESVYMMAMIFFVVACQIVNGICGYTDSWLNTREEVLIGYIVVQIICILLATVLPTWFIRKVVQVSEAILQLKREFVRYVSHEIRSPLNVVHAGLELLRAELIAADAHSSTLSLLQDIFFASSAAIDILNDMLQYEHIDSGTFKLDCAVVSILRSFAGRLDGFKFLLSTKNIALTVEDLAQVSEFYTPPNEGSSQHDGLELMNVPASLQRSVYSPSSGQVLFMDRFRVEQIIRNLMTNAVKFTPEGGNVTIRFLICSDDLQQQQREHLDALCPEAVAGFSLETLSVTKRFLRIEVQDSGVGIAIEDQCKMFKQFTQFNRNLLQGGGGSGLGLWICKNLASFHGGRMGFQSEGLGKGSTFFIDLPIYSSSVVKSSLHHDDPAFSNEPCLSDSAQLLYSLSEEVEDEDDDDNGGDRQQGAMVHPFSTLPAPAAAMPSTEVVQEAPSQVTDRLPTRILIADDSSMNRKIIRRMLESSTNEAAMGEVIVEEADDGSTAIQALRDATSLLPPRLLHHNHQDVDGDRDRDAVEGDGDVWIEHDVDVDDVYAGGAMRQKAKGFDIIFIDFVMTTMSGPEAVQIMRRDMNFTGGIIGVTGNALPADLTYFKECGADLVITKPLTNKKLMDAVHSVTNNKKRSMLDAP